MVASIDQTKLPLDWQGRPRMPQFVRLLNAAGEDVGGNVATAGTNLSGTATTTSGGFNIPANATRKPGDVQGQNISAVAGGVRLSQGYAAGIKPAVTTTAETPAGVTYRNDASVEEGTATITQVTIIVQRVPKTIVVSLLGAVTSIFAPAMTSVWVNVLVRAPV